MSEIVFKEYKTFSNVDQIQQYTEVLDKVEIKYQLENITPIFDPAFAGNTDNASVVLKLKSVDFLKANKAFEVAHSIDLATINQNYYLFTFTDYELMDVIVNRDEWNDFDFMLAQRLLKDRGKEVSVEILDSLKKQRQTKKYSHLTFPKTWIVAGYIFALLGGLISIFIALQLLWDTKKLPDGSKMYSYDSRARFHGKLIFWIGLIVLIFTILYNLLGEIDDIIN